MSNGKFERFISNSFRNVGQSFYDSYVEANVSFRSKLGMKNIIIRRQLGTCCDWCASLAGIYEANNAPDDIYRRHRNCRCLVTYKTEEGYQNVWNKKVYQTQRDARIEKIKDIEKLKLEAKFDNLKARKSKKLNDFLVDMADNISYIDKIDRDTSKEIIKAELRKKGFEKEYFIAKLPDKIGGGNAYLDVNDISYILSRHSKDIPYGCYSKLKDVIENYDILLKDKRYSSGFKFYKLYKSNDRKYGLEIAIDKKPGTNNEYIVHFDYIGSKKNKAEKRMEKYLGNYNIIDAKKNK